MDAQTILNALGAIALSALGWFARTIYTDVKEIGESLHAHKVEVARDYATNQDLQNIDKKLDRILERLSK